MRQKLLVCVLFFFQEDVGIETDEEYNVSFPQGC